MKIPKSDLGKARTFLYPKLNDYRKCLRKLFLKNELDLTAQAHGTSCGVGYDFIAILSNGDIVPCMPMRNVILGNVRTDDFHKIFTRHPIMKEIRESTVNNIDECRSCKAKKRCLGGCKQRVFEIHHSFFSSDNAQCVLLKDHYKTPKALNRSALCYIE